MVAPSRQKRNRLLWILAGVFGGLLVLTVLAAVFVPVLVTRWLGGDQFRQLASRQLSAILKTEGELQPLVWKSFSVYSGGFASRPGAPGPWLWDIQAIRAEISPRLLLDRILRFSEITLEQLQIRPALAPGTAFLGGTAEESLDSSGKSTELFHDVQIGKIEIRSADLEPSRATGGWGVRAVRAVLRPAETQTEFELHGGTVLHPFPWLGSLKIRSARGNYIPPTVFLTSLQIVSSLGGGLSISGEYTPGKQTGPLGTVQWSDWPIPQELSSLGIAKIRGKMHGRFTSEPSNVSGISGKGQVELVDSVFQVAPSVRATLKNFQSANETLRWVTSQSVGLNTSTFDVLSGLADDPRWTGARLSSAKADFQISSTGWGLNNLELEAPGFLRIRGQIRVQRQNLGGQIFLGMDPKLGRKINEFTFGRCFRQMESGYLVEPVELSGTLQQPQNSLAPKISSAAQQRAAQQAAQTVGAVLQKISGDQPGSSSPAGTAGQILNSLFGPSPAR